MLKILTDDIPLISEYAKILSHIRVNVGINSIFAVVYYENVTYLVFTSFCDMHCRVTYQREEEKENQFDDNVRKQR